MKRTIFIMGVVGIICLSLASCNGAGNMDEISYEEAEDDESIYEPFEWKDDPTIGQVQVGYYKRIGIAKKDETYEEMLELRKIENRGILIVYDDGTAMFDLDGEKTEYLYDEYNFYSGEDADGTSGIPYVYIGGRIITNDGSTITQYVTLSEDELESYLEGADK